MPVSFETGQQSGKMSLPSVCEQASHVISALPESGTNVGAKVNLVGSGAKNQEKIDKRNKQRRRKEMHKTTNTTKQHGGPKDPTASHVMRKHKKGIMRETGMSALCNSRQIKKKPLRKSTNRIITSETKRKTTWLDGTK